MGERETADWMKLHSASITEPQVAVWYVFLWGGWGMR